MYSRSRRPSFIYGTHPSARVVVEASLRAESCLPTGTPNSRMNSIASWLILDISRIVDVKRTLADKPTVAYTCSSNQADDMLKRCKCERRAQDGTKERSLPERFCPHQQNREAHVPKQHNSQGIDASVWS